jgi:hypothetical protein
MTCHRIPSGIICIGTSYTDAEERARKLYRQGHRRYRCQCGRYVWDGDECKCVGEEPNHPESPNSSTTDRKDQK